MTEHISAAGAAPARAATSVLPPAVAPGAAARTALVVGGSGLVGRELVRQLSADPGWSELRVLLRRPWGEAMDGPVPPRVRPVVIDFDALPATAPPAASSSGLSPAVSPGPADVFAVDAVFCALGTTQRQAGSPAAFRRVDFDYPLAIARRARAAGARHFLLVSALGADARSRVFYSRVKGELEEALRAQGWPGLTIARPSFLDGGRRAFRLGERLALPLARVLPPPWRAVPAAHVAAALIAAAHGGPVACQWLDNRALLGARPQA